jgi:hypothetical protein
MMTLPSVEVEVSFVGLIINIEFKPQSVMLILAAGLAAAGSEWLIKSDPQNTTRSFSFEHWVIPSFAAIAIGFVVMRIPGGPQLWIALVLGALLLVAVLNAEFIVAFREDPRRRNIVVALRGLSFLLMTGAFYAIYDTQLRALFTIPFIFAISFLIAWRSFRLEIIEFQIWTWAGLLGLLSAQLALGLHYFPINPLTNSIVLGVLTYVGHGLILTHIESDIFWRHIIEGGVLFLASIVILAAIN